MVIIPIWSETVGYSLATEGCEVWVNCSRCGMTKRLDLARVVLAKGPLYSLWGRRPEHKGCGGQLLFNGRHSSVPGCMVVPFVADDGEADPLHERWALAEAHRRPDDHWLLDFFRRRFPDGKGVWEGADPMANHAKGVVTSRPSSKR